MDEMLKDAQYVAPVPRAGKRRWPDRRWLYLLLLVSDSAAIAIGFLIAYVVRFQADGRMTNVICDGRAAVPAGEERQFMAYTGIYTFDGTTLTTRVDGSSEASRIGGEQLRSVRFENGDMVLSPPRRLFAGVMQHQSLYWERVE